LFSSVFNLFIKIKAITPPKKQTVKFIISSLKLIVPDLTISKGSKPSLPNNLIKKILPNTPAIVFPTIPKEYFLKVIANIFAPIIPVRILNNEIKVAVILIA
jgi:hypothetical protein